MHTVRTSVTALALLLAVAATSSAETVEEKLEAKLKEPFVANAPWILDYADALRQAKAEKKIIFAYFTRSYSP